MDDSETSDLSGIDIEDVIRRHSVLKAGQFRPATLIGYQGHLRGAIKDFLDYAKNPSTWRPGIKTKVSKTKPATTSKEAKRQEQASKPEAFVEEVRKPKQPSIHIDFHIHISPESTPEQIDKIFESMSSHFGNRTG